MVAVDLDPVIKLGSMLRQLRNFWSRLEKSLKRGIWGRLVRISRAQLP